MDGGDDPRDFLGVEFQQAVELAVEPLDVGTVQVDGGLRVEEGGLEQPHLVEALRCVGIEDRSLSFFIRLEGHAEPHFVYQ